MIEQLIEFTENHPILVFSFAGLLGFILFTEFQRLTQKFSNIGPSAAILLINNEEPIVLDVREQSEINAGMLNDAVHIPLSAFKQRVGEVEQYKDKSVLVYCRSGSRSGSACRTLSARGFEKVYNLAGGIMAWQDAHLPLAREKKQSKKKKKKNA